MTKAPHIIAMGEILWDVFPDRTCFGGAPANFACAAAGMGDASVNVFLLSGGGADALGEEAIQKLETNGVSTSLVQKNDFQTGRVDIELNPDRSANYVFPENVAWDTTQWNDTLNERAKIADAVCFGTLGQRNLNSADVIQQFIESTSENCLRVLDINLRFPHVNELSILKSLQLCNVLKLNDEELPYLAELLNLDGDESDWMSELLSQFELKLIALTRGAKGSTLFTKNEWVNTASTPTKVVDTVGAGDTFAAMLTLGLLVQRHTEISISEIAQLASRAAEYVCTQPGATPHFPNELKLNSLNSKPKRNDV